MSNAKCRMLVMPALYIVHCAFCIFAGHLCRVQQQAFIETARPVTLEVERDVAISSNLQLAYDGCADLRIERTRHFVACDLDARDLVVMPHTKDSESQIAKRPF